MIIMRAFRLVPLAIIGIVGAVSGQETERLDNGSTVAQETTLADFTAGDLVGRQAFLAEDEPAGTISALLYDEAGDPAQVILTLKAEIGTQGRQVAVPWMFFSYDATVDSVMLDELDSAALISYPDYVPTETAERTRAPEPSPLR